MWAKQEDFIRYLKEQVKIDIEEFIDESINYKHIKYEDLSEEDKRLLNEY